MPPPLVPELLCTDLPATLAFYVGVLGFRVRYDRPDETFAYLTRDDCQLMFEQLDGPGRRWITGPLDRPFGRGINLQLAARDVAALYAHVTAARPESIYLPLEEREYRCGETVCAVRQFIVQDPDGYLLRFAEDVQR